MRQPAGTVTLVFTDVEGSTRLLTTLGTDGYREALAEHRRIVRASFTRFGGYEVDYEGDAFFYAFASAADAVAAAQEAVEGLAAGPIRIRVGVHTGTPQVDPPKYLGLDVHLAARVMSVGHGGQILLSRATRVLADVDVVDLGEHRLKDFDAPVWLYQVGRERHPPLTSLDNTNLPNPLGAFHGRAHELEEAAKSLRTSRLVTILGPGGVGKTRFAIELARAELARFPNGVFWVELAGVQSPRLVPDSIATTIGAGGELADHIGARRMLLLLDNFEHVVDAAPELSQLLRACPNVGLLVTSRERLRIEGERVYELPPLSLAEALALFADRGDVEPDAAAAELCDRLDRLPLAIELASARLPTLSARQMLDRLQDRLDLLRGGRDRATRQHTLRTTIAWSYELLDPEERRLFARFAIFRGGARLEAVEAVCDAEFDVVESLRDKSLIVAEGERFSMLETIREYAWERLLELPDAPELHARHARCAVELARTAGRRLEGTSAQMEALVRLSQEIDNLRAALAWACASDPSLMLELAGRLGLFFWLGNHLREGLEWLETALAADDGAGSSVRAYGLEAAARLAFYRGDVERNQRYAEQAVTLWRLLGDGRGLARALREQGNGLVRRSENDRARPVFAEAVALARATHDEWNLAMLLNNLADLALHENDPVRALDLCEESLALRRRRGDEWGSVIAGFNVGMTLIQLGRHEEAGVRLRDTLRLSRKVDLPQMTGETLVALAAVESAAGRPQRAAELLGAADQIFATSEETLGPLEAELRNDTVDAARSALGVERYEQIRAAGASDSLTVMSEVLGGDGLRAASRTSASHGARR